MDITIITLLLVSGGFLAVFSRHTDDPLMKLFSAVIFIITGVFIIGNGIDITSGKITITNTTGNITNQTTTNITTPVDNMYVSGLGTLFVLLGIYFVFSFAFGYFKKEVI